MRLACTEGTYVSRQAQLAELAREGFSEYRVEPVGDERTCGLCSALVGKSFRVEDAMPGVNLPPIHPNFRCQIAPAVDDWDAWMREQADRKRAELAARRVGGGEAENPLHPVPGEGSVRYGKPVGDLTPHERRGIEDLVRLGYKVAVPKEDPHALANIDLLLGHDGAVGDEERGRRQARRRGQHEEGLPQVDKAWPRRGRRRTHSHDLVRRHARRVRDCRGDKAQDEEVRR